MRQARDCQSRLDGFRAQMQQVSGRLLSQNKELLLLQRRKADLDREVEAAWERLARQEVQLGQMAGLRMEVAAQKASLAQLEEEVAAEREAAERETAAAAQAAAQAAVQAAVQAVRWS